MRLRQGETLDLTTGGNGDCWEVELDPKSEVQHPTQKPAELACRAIRNHCQHGDIVLDSFGGSGSSMMAAELTATQARLCELDPRYVDVAIKRFEAKYPGQPIVRQDGISWAEAQDLTP